MSLPHSYYSTFVIEEKYGMNKTTKKTFFLDTVKAFLISALKKLVKESLSDINPHSWEIALNYSHPTLSMRIDAIRSID